MDVRSSKSIDEKILVEPNSSNKLQRSLSSLTSTAVASKGTSTSPVSVETTIKQDPRVDLRSKLNEVINVKNVANDATNQISRLVKSIDGIVEQVKTSELPEQRKNILELEANQLVDEIKKTANAPASNGIRPLTGEKIRLEVEERIGKTLEIILPDDAKNAFGIGNISFSTKDSIISTIASVEEALQSINKLREAVEISGKDIENTATSIDVALQNSESAATSIRDLDEALKVASETRTGIGNDPSTALNSVGELDSKALNLLNQ